MQQDKWLSRLSKITPASAAENQELAISTANLPGGHTPTSEGMVHFSQLTPGHHAAITQSIIAGSPVRLFSDALGCVVWWCKDQAAIDALRRQGHTEACYTLDELKILAAAGSKDLLRGVHAIKQEFDGTVVSVAPQMQSVNPVTAPLCPPWNMRRPRRRKD